MADKQVLQRGNHVTIDSKGNRSSRPLDDGEVEAQAAANKRPFGAEAATAAADATVGRMQRMENRRDKTIEDASRGYKQGGLVRRGYGKARGA
jgi:hypothetical protein